MRKQFLFIEQSVLVIALCILHCVELSAVEPTQWDSIPEDNPFWLQEVTITGTPKVFVNQVIEKTPEQIRVDNIGQNLPYLLNNTPGLVTTSDDGLGIGYTYFHIRGTDHSRINMTLNDVPLNDPESQTVFWVNMTDMGSNLSGIKIQRGVGASVSGSSAFGASLNMNGFYDLKQLREQPIRAEVSFTGGMYNTFRESVQLYAKKGNWHFGGRVSKVNSDGYIDRAFSDLFSYKGEVGWQSPQQANGAKTSVTLIALGGKEKTYMAWYGVDEATMNANRRFNPAGLMSYTTSQGEEATIAYPDQTDNYTQHHAQLHIRHTLNRHWSLRAIAHYTYGTGFYEMADYGAYTDTTGWSGITRDGLTNHTAGAQMQAQYLNDKWSAVFGVVGQYYICDHWGTLSHMNTYRGRGSKWDANIYAKFSQFLLQRAQERLTLYEDVQYRLVDHLMTGDIDYTWAGNTFTIHPTYHFFNPKAGLEYFNHGHQLTVSFAMANREPTRANFIDAVLNGRDNPRPEMLLDYELGYNYSFTKEQTGASGVYGSVGANLYFMQYKDQLVATGQVDVNNYAILANIANSYRTGIELQYTFHFTKWLSFEGNLVWSRNRWKVSSSKWNNLSFSPDWTAYNALNFHVAGFTGIINNQVVSSQYLTNDEEAYARLNAYTVTNLNLSYILPIKKTNAPQIELRCLINNLFDTKYCSNGGSADGYTWYFPQAGINVHAGFAVRW